jgi:hypothetical protein
MMALINPEKKQGANIDVYLEPFIDDLIELWKGKQVMDVLSPIDKFHLLYAN